MKRDHDSHSSRSAAHLEIIKLWSSVFLIQELPEHEASTRRLITLATDRPEDGVFGIDDPSVDWLRAHIDHAMAAYLHKAGFSQPLPWRARGRFDIQDFGDYRALANQPDAYLTGMYVLQWPSEHREGGRRDDARPGCVSFYDPRTAMNMTAIKQDPYKNYERTVRPVPGLLLLWPAHINYFVHPNLSGQHAIRVSIEIQLQGESEGK